jgi:hypothetical protein
MTRLRQGFVLITIVFAWTAAAQEVTTRVLLPFTWWELPGAHGTVWQTQTWIQNRGTSSAAVAPAACLGPILCGSGFSIDPTSPPSRFIAAATVTTGLLAHIRSLPGADVVFSSRIRDLSHASDSSGTEVPAIPEEEFAAGSLSLIDVPTIYGARTLLRVYALPEAAAPREVEVRYYRIPDPGDEVRLLLRTDRLRLDVPVRSDIQPRYLAAYGQIAGIEFLPELFFGESAWIEVVPLTPGLRIWALASVTNNATQQVTLVTPMRR